MAAGKLNIAEETEVPEDKVLETVMRRALEVIGDREQALRWLGTPVRALGYSTPISMLGSVPGEQAVLAVLGRLEHGIS
jgi:putative toxin-antitoxin system antitoxin component (TIGR02293 family)